MLVMALINKLLSTMELPEIEVTPRFLRHATESRIQSLVQEIELFREELHSLPAGSRLTFTTIGSPEDDAERDSLRFMIDATLIDERGAIHSHQLVLEPGTGFAESLRTRLRSLKHLANMH